MYLYLKTSLLQGLIVIVLISLILTIVEFHPFLAYSRQAKLNLSNCIILTLIFAESLFHFQQLSHQTRILKGYPIKT